MPEHTERSGSSPDPAGPRALKPEEHLSALGLINSALRPNSPHEIEKEYPLVLGKKNIDNMRVIVSGGQVISHAAVYISTLRSGDLAFKVGGVSSVATDAAHRGRGLGSEVVRDCIRVMEKASCHLSILWTQRQDFYRNLGYETAGSSYIFKASAPYFFHIPSPCRVIPYSPRYLPAITKIHRRDPLRTARSAKEYDTYLDLPRTNTLIAKRDKDVTAYAVMGKGEDLRNCVHDWGGEAEDLLCLVRDFMGLTDKGELMILAPAQRSEFTQMLNRMRIPKTFEYLAMMRVIDVEALSAHIGDHMSEKLGREFRIHPSGSEVTIRVGDEETMIDPPRNLVRVLFGPEMPSKLLGGLSRETLSALDRALPIPLFIWGLDSV